ncbi:helix-turn-helix transcriptional regulator [Microbacterium hominis]|uniref:LuxR family transcriptional regulator n=1 Tax=Microbacterium hominis TaxID=162426 RepID=A0A7D4PTS6_9MICO|nr:LuxR C-terminal-related transcriptional regulator [Microbacterium hominis]QKJ18734.1 LuxR family transcriptional regulator [Microbacterium hominis]
MTSALAVGRARSDIDVMSRAGLPLHRFMDEATVALQRVVPFVAGCLSTLDPATSLVSSTRKFGDLDGRNADDVTWARIEYGADDPTAITAMVDAGQVALGVRDRLGENTDQSVRMADLLIPRFDYRDEARVVFSDRSGAWGSLCVFRAQDDTPFTRAELDFLASAAPAFTRGIRAGLLSQTTRTDSAAHAGPAVLVIDAADRLVQASPGAHSHLERMAAVPRTGDPLACVYSLVSGARRFGRGETDRMPRVRVRTSDGVWLVLHAAPLGGAGERAGDVVVTIEEARPQEVIDLVAAAFGLTARERDVVASVLRGADTKEIATAMHVSPYTVQDHLKSIFEKAGVTSRRELVARVYFDQYAPRYGDAVGSSGWFVSSDPVASAAADLPSTL